jgi:putative membrane protein
MHFKWLNNYWVGFFVSLTLIVLSLWLALQGKLALYIHPRYIWFTVILCGLGLACIVADAVLHKKAPKLTRRTHIRSAAAGILCIAFCLGMLILPPVGLTSSTAGQRGINTAALTINTDTSLADLSSAQANYARFTIKDWASLLAQTSDGALFAGKSTRITGFVSPTPDKNPNVFYLSRFVMTCCAVDARPIGVPIYKPGWQKEYKPDQWLDVAGVFRQNPESSTNAVVLEPQNVTRTDEPEEPYVY